MSRSLARRVYCRTLGTPAEALALRAQTDPAVQVGQLGDAVMLYPGPDVLWSTVIGLGLDDTPVEAVVPAIDGFFGPLGAQPELLLTPYTRPEMLATVADAGFRLKGFRHLLIARRPLAARRPSPGLRIDAGPADGVIARGFKDGAEPAPSDLALERTFALPSNVTTFVATIDGVPAGGGRVAVHDGVALLFGASVLPAWRGRGVQTALLARRVEHARRAGADCVIVESTAGHGTARNALRLGFEVAFTNVVFKRT